MLKNKKVLLIAPSFFGYESDIVQEMIALGVDVDYFDERPFKSSIAKIINRLDLKFILRGYIRRYFKSILKQSVDKNYDFLLVISPETLGTSFVSELKAINPNVISILYMWDSFSNKVNARKLLPYFDSVTSFDPGDKSINSNIEFLPLFFNNDFNSRYNKLNHKQLYSVAFVGTVHSDRVKLAKQIVKQFEERGVKTFSFYYCPSKLLFILKKLFTKEYDFISYSEVSFKAMSKSEIKTVFLQSNAVIDIQHPAQKGLTMRSLEMLGLEKKLITTNCDIRSYDFFDERNILVIDRINPQIPDDFISMRYTPISRECRSQYSLRSWIYSVLKIT
ncbi:lipopolysaccharide biosynthesis protein [Aliivibrio salmonicida]|uniref:lipopolysaccharide biosynthesis protein n=1 Tax=Aliivibrio salmonicida TaxID=40269 RepID=UPI003D13262F